jgi:hypothetical protein
MFQFELNNLAANKAEALKDDNNGSASSLELKKQPFSPKNKAKEFEDHQSVSKCEDFE